MNRDNVYRQLKIDEGVKFEIYKDHKGYLTTGVGHLIKESDEEYGKPVGTKITEDRCFDLFETDLDFYINECRILYGSQFDFWPGEVQEILVNMCFNLGRTRLSGFKKMNAALAKNDWKEAAKEGKDSKWYTEVPNRAERLMSRMRNV